MRKLFGQLTYSRVVSTLALFLALGAGGAWAISLGKNDVKSRNIAKGAVKSSDVAKKTLRGTDVKPDSLKGSKIVESTLDTAQFTAAASAPASGPPFQPIRCDPEGGLVPCGDVSLTTPVAGRILVIASGEVIPIPIANGGAGSCRLYVDGTQIAELPAETRQDRPFTLSALSAPLPAGPHRAELQCLEDGQEVQVAVYGITAALAGGG